MYYFIYKHFIIYIYILLQIYMNIIYIYIYIYIYYYNKLWTYINVKIINIQNIQIIDNFIRNILNILECQ